MCGLSQMRVYMNATDDRIRVLHVDDKQNFRDLVGSFLEREDDRIEVQTASSPGEALDMLVEQTVDCIISDYEMPRTDGIEFLKTVRSAYPRLPFILFTGKGSEQIASEAISAGVTDYLHKQNNTEQYKLLCKRIENAVTRRRAQTNYRELFEKTPVGLTIHDPETGEILDANKGFGATLGYDPSELEGKHPGELSPEGSPFGRQKATHLIQRTVETGSERFEWQDQTKDGDMVWVEVSLKRTTIDGQLRVLAVVQNITDRKERGQKLQRERERFRALFESLPEPVARIRFESGELVVQDVNEAFEDTFGRDRDAVVGQPIAGTVVPEDQTEGAKTIDRQILSGEMVRREIRQQTGDRMRDFLFTTAPVGASDPIDELFGIAFDITERKQYERELEQQNEQLEAFTSIVSHDLRNPLDVAGSRLELADDECDSEHLTQIRQAHRRMRTLIDDLLTLSKKGRMITNLESVDVATVAHDSWNNVEVADATLVTDIDRAIRADESRLKQLFENCIRNAITHGADSVTVRVGELDDGFYIADDGPGIPEDQRTKVFENGYSTSEQGTGFGLSIINRVVNAHGWNIDIAESSTGGARFEVTGVEFDA